MEQSTIENLPPEILEIIFSNLVLKDIISCYHTCIKWNQIIAELYKNRGKNNLF